MGADLAESFVGAIIAAAILGSPFLPHVALPFWIAPSGIVAAIIAYFFVGTKKKVTQKNDLIYDLSKGNLITGFLLTGFSAIIVWKFYQNFAIGWRLFGCIIIGHICGLLISQSTEYFTSHSFWPTRSITDAAITGPATVIIQGLGVGMISTAASVLLLVMTVFVS
jgi:Na+/H+-translocating membrane pyrophosphatase